MPEFWESHFITKQEMWGMKPADSAITAVDIFRKHNLNTILIPGFGYGRNAECFDQNGFSVSGIEISKSAIELAKKHYGKKFKVFHGSVLDMPFDDVLYDGIFCYSLIHLLNAEDRLEFIKKCYEQLVPEGVMIFVALSQNDIRYGSGEEISSNTFLTKHGISLFFYNESYISEEFGSFGLQEFSEVHEPLVNNSDKPSETFWFISCKKI